MRLALEIDDHIQLNVNVSARRQRPRLRPPRRPSGPNQTIADYIKQNGIQETMISHTTPGAPTIDLPVPDGWKVVPESTDAPYGGIAFNTPTDPNDPPKIIAIVEKLTGNVDTDKLLAVAPGEVKNLPGYDGGDGDKSTLSGFPAYQTRWRLHERRSATGGRPEDGGDPGQGRPLRASAQC